MKQGKGEIAPINQKRSAFLSAVAISGFCFVFVFFFPPLTPDKKGGARVSLGLIPFPPLILTEEGREDSCLDHASQFGP